MPFAFRSQLKSRLSRRLLLLAAVGLPAIVLLVVEAQAAGAPGSWASTANMAVDRSLATATLLSNGNVLVAGGSPRSAGASAELYAPSTGTWATTGTMAAARESHTATLLPSGKVLVAGGDSLAGGLASAELYDPATGTWSTTGSMATGRRSPTATLLSNGKVLVVGGYNYPPGSLFSAELYDPTTGTWSATAGMAFARDRHSATLLSNGKVLVAGGGNNSDTAEVYDPATGTFSITGSMNDFRTNHTATLLSNGKVLAAGGGLSPAVASADLYDPATGTWSTTGRMVEPRTLHTANLLSSGKVLVAGGDNDARGTLASAELYDPATGSWSTTASMAFGHTQATGTLLSNGKVLVAGGDPPNYTSAELFNPSPTPEGSALLRVTSSPALSTQILVDGQIADTWALNWLKEPPGSHAVCFKRVEGWTEPPCQTVTLNAGTTTTVTGSFTQRGLLHVFTSPAVPSQITLDGNPTDDWGMFTDVPTGAHTVCYGKVANFDPPACQSITVTAGTLTTTTGTFISHPGALGQTGVGLLQVTQASPAVSSQILIKAGAGSPYIADSWGLNWLELAPGSYTVSFSRVPGWTEPSPQTVTVTAGSTTTVTGTFSQRGLLHVFTSPAVAATIFIDGIPRDDWGVFTDLPAGLHSVCFGQATGFANTPVCQSVNVTSGGETAVTGAYS